MMTCHFDLTTPRLYMGAIYDREAHLEEQLSILSSNYTKLCDERDTLRGENDRYKHMVENATEVFMRPCKQHSGERTPSLSVFVEKYGCHCIVCLVNERDTLQAELAAVRGELERVKASSRIEIDALQAAFVLVRGERDLALDAIARIRHAAGEFNSDSKNALTVVREMASTIRQQQGVIQDSSAELTTVREQLEQADNRIEEQDITISALTSEHDQLREAVEWQPIETADTLPRDGSHFLLIDMLNKGIPFVAVYFDSDFMECNDGTWIEVESYTHWKRLAPPIQPQPEGREDCNHDYGVDEAGDIVRCQICGIPRALIEHPQPENSL
jgi:hypothetical protein